MAVLIDRWFLMGEESQNSTFVPGFSHDLFVSYAHVDNTPVLGAEQGWVTTLVQDLQNLLAQQLGRQDNFSIWWDEYDLRGDYEITPEIRAGVQRSATLLLVLSPGYLSSTWCQREMELFLQELEAEAQRRVFVVRRQPLAADQTPEALIDFKGYQFWYRNERKRIRRLHIDAPEPHKTDYTELVEDLADDISQRLQAMARKAEVVPPEPKATVYLAEVTDDLEPRREQIRRYLESELFEVLPARRHLEGQAFQQELAEALDRCDLFVQLLGEFPGKRPPDIPQGYARLQWERAQALDIPILQWRAPDLAVDTVESTKQRELLETETVCAEPLSTFKETIVATAIPPEPPSPTPVAGGAPFVFINAERRDRDLAETIRDKVGERTIATLPLNVGAAAEMRKDLEQKLQECDALIVVYGEGPVGWVDKQLLHYDRVRPNRKQNFRALAVYDGPPEEKPEIPTRMPGLEILSCRQGVDGQRIQEFLAPLLGGPGQ